MAEIKRYNNLETQTLEGEWVKHSDHLAAIKAAVAADATATVNARRLELYARQLSEAISHLPEGLEGYLESLDAPLSELRDALTAIDRVRGAAHD